MPPEDHTAKESGGGKGRIALKPGIQECGMAAELGLQKAHIHKAGISEGGQPLELSEIEVHIPGEAAVEEDGISGELAVPEAGVLSELGAEE